MEVARMTAREPEDMQEAKRSVRSAMSFLCLGVP
jgi:hypothetical protein